MIAGRMLADLGADVVQVEPAGGSTARRYPPLDPGGTSLFFDAYAANKRGVTADPDSPAGQSSRTATHPRARGDGRPSDRVG